jgi:hypothetical protein
MDRWLLRFKDFTLLLSAFIGLAAIFFNQAARPAINERRLADIESYITTIKPKIETLDKDIDIIKNDTSWIKRSVIRIENRANSM